MQHECVIYNCDKRSYKGKIKGVFKENVVTQHESVFITATNVVTS